MITVDMKTVMVANIIVNAVCLIVLLQLWRQNHNKYPGLNYWVADWVLQVGGSVLIALRGTIPDWASMVVSNSMIVGGTLVLYFGLCRFTARKSARLLNYLILAYSVVFVLIHIYFTYVDNELFIRSFNASIGLSIACFLGMWLMLRGVSPDIRRISTGTGVAFAVIIFLSLLRIIGFSVLPHTSNDYFHSGMYDTVLVLILIGAVVFLTFNLVLMVNRRLCMESNEMEEAVSKSQKELQATFSATSVGFAVLVNRIVKEVNEAGCRMLGYSRQEIVGKDTRLFYPTEEAYQQNARLYPQVAEVGTVTTETRLIRKDGKTIDAIMNVSAFDKNNLSLGVILSLIDISQRKQLERERETFIDELTEKNTALEHFTYTVSHDLKSPLYTIKTFLGYLKGDIAGSNARRIEQDMQYMNDAADKMGKQLEELLEMSLIGHTGNPPVTVNFQELVQEILNLLAGNIEERGVKVQVSGESLTIEADHSRLLEIWQNLVENAVKFMGDQPSPRIDIGVEGHDRETVFFVRDNGIGIEPQYQSKIFNLFEKINPRSQGTGMGLAIVKRIVELYQGKIWVESQGLGQGTCFRFTLPGALEVEGEGGKV